MSDVGLLSSVHANFEDYAALVDDAIMELQSGEHNGPAAKKLQALLEAASKDSMEETPLRALMFASVLAGPAGVMLDDLADLAKSMTANGATKTKLVERLSKLAIHLEEERAALAHRLGR